MRYSGIYGSSTLPPISGVFEIARSQNVSLGAFAAFAGSEDTWNYYHDYYYDDEYGWKYTYVGLGGRVGYHYGLFNHEKVDTYLGLALGYTIVSSSVIGTDYGRDASSGYVMYGGFLGGRYYVKPNMAIVAELGYGGLGSGTIGLSFKF